MNEFIEYSRFQVLLFIILAKNILSEQNPFSQDPHVLGNNSKEVRRPNQVAAPVRDAVRWIYLMKASGGIWLLFFNSLKT